MTEIFAFWEEIKFISLGNLFSVALLVNILLTTILIFQNIRNHKVYQAFKETIRLNHSATSDEKIPPFPSETVIGLHTMPKADVEQSKLNRTIKMIKEDCSPKDIKKAIDIEAAYLSILLKNYNSNKS